MTIDYRVFSLKLEQILEVDVVWQIQSEEEWQVIPIQAESLGPSVLLDVPSLIRNICSETVSLVPSPV